MRLEFKLITMIVIFFLIITVNTCFALEGLNPDDYKITQTDTDLSQNLSGVIGIVQIVGVGIAAISCVILGIRYVISTVEDRAEIKKKLIPYVIGTVLFFCATGILQMISEVAKWFGE